MTDDWRIRQPDPFLTVEAGYAGVFTRHEAEGAIPNGTRIVKVAVDGDGSEDAHPIGARGVVLGSLEFPPGAVAEVRQELAAKGLDVPDVTFAYFVEWEARPRVAVGVMDWKIARADDGG